VEFDLSQDQRALQSAARDLLDAAASSDRVRAVLGSPAGFDPDLWREMVAQGWHSVALPDEEGGAGLGWVDVAVLAEEVGRHVAPAPFVSTVLAVHALARSDNPAARPWVQRLAAGDAVGAVAWRGGLVVDGPVADVIVHVTPEGVVAHEQAGRRMPAAPAMAQTRSVGWLRPDGPGIALGGTDLATDVLDAAATVLSAEILGLAGRMLDVSVAYACVREQFGRPIGSFQAVKHRCADMLVDVEGIRSATWYAAWALATAAPDASLAASTAKAWASEAGPRVLGSALQVHGGIGFTWEHDLHLFLKRTQLDSVQFGDAAWHRERLAGRLRELVTAGESVFPG